MNWTELLMVTALNLLLMGTQLSGFYPLDSSFYRLGLWLTGCWFGLLLGWLYAPKARP